MPLIAWVPLLLMSALGGQVVGGGITVPFLSDLGVHVRFLLALPLLIAAEVIVHQHMRPILGQLLQRGIAPQTPGRDSTRAWSQPCGCATRSSPKSC